MIYLYCPPRSDSARHLGDALGEGALRVRDPIRTLTGVPYHPQKGDLLVNWGAAHPHSEALALKGVRVLNPVLLRDKLRELVRMELRGVRVPKWDLVPHEGWYGRRLNHQGGHDLLSQVEGHTKGDYFVQREEVGRELRFHITATPDGYVSMRSGVKTIREGFPNPHPWIRSYDSGWWLDYGPVQDALIAPRVKKRAREEAKRALGALELDFGAVDVGIMGDGSPMVFEVNTRPGVEGNTTSVYASRFREIHNGLCNVC